MSTTTPQQTSQQGMQHISVPLQQVLRELLQRASVVPAADEPKKEAQ